MDNEFVKREKNHWGKIYTDITYAISEISPLIDENELSKRKFYLDLPTLKKYVELLNSTESIKKGFFSKLFNKDSSEGLLVDYKSKNQEAFDQLEFCSRCTCLNCIRECEFKGCLDCRYKSRIKKCDKVKINMRNYDNFIINLTNNNTGMDGRYKVLATLEDIELNREYIIFQNINDINDKYILYYYPGISEDEYGEISDVDEFNFIVETFERQNQL